MRINLFAQGGVLSLGTFSSPGGTMTGPLLLTGTFTTSNAAVNKAYVDNLVGSVNTSSVTTGVFPASVLPAFTGDVTNTAGSNSFTLNSIVTPGTYIAPVVNSKGLITGGGTLTDSDILSVDWNKIISGTPTTLLGYNIADGISLNSNSTITDLLLPNDPTGLNEAATKQYVDNRLSLRLTFHVGDTLEVASATTPTGFLRCNGAVVSQTTYSALYAVIGNTYSSTGSGIYPGSGKPWKQQYEFNTNTATDLAAWTTSVNSLSAALAYSQAIVTKNRVYLLGGYNSIYTSAVYTAPINVDGTLGTWTTSANSLPGPLGFSQAIVTKNRVYLLGGSNNTGYTSNVYTAPINADGTLGTWTTSVNSLPGPLGNSQAIVTKNRVYLLGGDNTNGRTSVVYTAPINADGTLGTWATSVNSLPVTLSNSHAIVTSSRVYLLGGFANGAYSSVVYTAPINTDGTLGTWTTSVNSLPGALAYSQAIVTKNRVYLLGGNNGGYTSVVYTAPINVDGTLGTWTTSANSLPNTLAYSQAIVTSSRVYLLGGFDGVYNFNVYETPFTGGLDDYSPYYDGTYPFIQTAGPGEFNLPDTISIDSQTKLYTYIKY